MFTRRAMLMRAAFYLVVCLGIALAAWQLVRADQGLQRIRARVGNVPVEVFAPVAAADAGPAVVVAHGFSASKQTMYPLAHTLASHGYVAAVFDFGGHGANTAAFPYDWRAVHSGSSALTQELEAVLAYVRGLPQVRGDQVALIGYSMGSAVVTRYARDHQDIPATIAISAVFSDVLPAQPRNLLLLTGALELPRQQAIARAALAASGGSEGEEVAGDLAAGDARKLAFVPYTEHTAVPYSPRTLREAVAWLDGTFGRSSAGSLDGRLPWLGLLVLCALVLFWPLSRALLQGRFDRPEPCPLELLGTFLVIAIPAFVAPALLRGLPYHILPLAAGDYMVALLALQGLLMIALMAAMGSLGGPILARFFSGRLWLAALLLLAYLVFAVGAPLHLSLLNALPTPQRAAIIGAAFLLIAPYFVAVEYATRSASLGPSRVLPLLAKALLLASIAFGASAGGLGPSVLLYFLPGLALLLLGGHLLSRRIYALSGEPVVSGLFMALIFAWLTGTLFPVA